MTTSIAKISDNMAKKAEFGRRLLPNVIDEIAQEEPSRECFSIPRSSKPEDGWQAITFKEYSNAINHISYLIVEKCGHAPPNTTPTLAYIGPNDIRYVVLLIAAIKAGYKALFISPRNSDEAQMNLFDKTDCQFICFPASHRVTVQQWVQKRAMLAVEVPPIDSWFPSHEVKPFPYGKTFEQAEWEPLVVLHTSGSTGLPKPVVVRQGMLAVSDAYHNVPNWKGLPTFIRVWSEYSKRQLAPFPLFHAGGLYLFFTRAIYWGNPVALGVADRPLSADLAVECLKNVDVEGILLAPMVLEEMSQSAHYIQALSKLKMVIFGGSHLSRDSGNKLSSGGVKLVNAIAATEFSPFPMYVQSDPDLWQYFVINSDIFGAEWRRMEVEDDVYRLVIVRKNEHPGYQTCFYTFPDNQEYDTGDIYKPHPTLPDYWLYCGRLDNIVVFSSGEKINPTAIEEKLERHPLVKGALVLGFGRLQAGLLVEPLKHPKDDQETQQFIDNVWPSVEEVNRETGSHGQISRSFVMFSNPQKPLPRGGKGSIQRANALKLYQEEIDELYEKGGEVADATVTPIDLGSVDALVESIRQLFQLRVGHKGKGLDPDTDFFSAGIDSLQVINACRLIRAGLQVAGHDIDVPTRAIYSNPTLRQLSTYIYSTARDGTVSVSGDDKHATQAMETLRKRYTKDYPKARENRQDPVYQGQTVILTGSTGNLGSYLLDLLTRDPAVERVICLNRADDGGKKRQAEAMEQRGLNETWNGSKCTFLHADTTQRDFGLGHETYSKLLKDVDRFIHNAWRVDFNIQFESFEPQLQGVRNIANFAAQASKRVAVTFISSVGTVGQWDSLKRGPVPEERLEDMSLPSNGYGRSKMIGSLILEDIAKHGDFPVVIIRVGQIAGSEAGAGIWAKRELIPSVIASSLYLKALPSGLARMSRVDWTPVEKIASMVLEISGASERVPARDISGYFHGVNPTASSWNQLALAVQDFYGKDRLPELISLKDWVSRLEKSRTQGSLDANPGIKLLDTFREMCAGAQEPVILDTRRILERSPSMRSATAITPDLMKRWCSQWEF
ncbi:hypothetical protein F4781DRAFT_408665 [Annulohypoxylon bovei var. microspora]|nr:hypothetical protein F4781DRAFT_408665 [Annulohypoxylon bovei var. microspora]